MNRLDSIHADRLVSSPPAAPTFGAYPMSDDGGSPASVPGRRDQFARGPDVDTA